MPPWSSLCRRTGGPGGLPSRLPPGPGHHLRGGAGHRGRWGSSAGPLLVPGWGATEQQALFPSDTLQALEVEVVSVEQCQEAMPDLTIGPGMLCAGGVEGEAPCKVSGAYS